MHLLEPIGLGPITARNRILFGPIVTNLGTDDRTFSARHNAFYGRVAAGGCGTIVLEEAAVHPSDWPYERSPLAERCAESWAQIGRTVRANGALALAALGHSGGQGTSAYSQRELWAPSRVPEVATREVPKWMDDEDIAAVIEGFRAAAALAAEAGLDGVEINAGQHSLVRQFLSGLTNQRNDQWGTDRLTFAREVIAATRQGLGPDRVVSLRLSCDEMAPWAGITAEMANDIAIELAGLVDVLVVVKGSIFTVQATRPDHHEPTGFNIELCRSIRTAIGESVPVVLQGSVIDTGQAEWAVSNDVCDLVEMTRGQLADAELVAKLRAGAPEQIRPCIRCNQTCQVRDARNPIIGCVGDPTTGHETDEPWSMARRGPGRRILVIGAGPAGLEAARVAAERGHTVSVVDRSKATGGVAGRAGPGQPLVQWLAAECARLGVTIETDVEISDPFAHRCQPEVVVVASGSRPGQRTYEVADGAVVLDVLDSVPDAGVVAIWDPIGGPIAVAVAENLGARAVLITPDQIAGNELSRTGDLAPANTRLQQGGVTIERRAVLRAVRPGEIEIEDRFTGVRRTLAANLLVDAGFRLPAESFADLSGPKVFRIGDCVAPRTIAEAVLEGRRVALSL